MHNYKKLNIWLKSYTLSRDIYLTTNNFPKTEIYSITSQIKRSAVSIPSNIAEGSKRSSAKEFKYFIGIARGSLAELETQLMLSADFGYIDKEKLKFFLKETEILSKMLTKFHKSLQD